MDIKLFAFLNGFAGQSALLDGVVRVLAGNPLFKGIFVAMVLVALWAHQDEGTNRRRVSVVTTLGVSFVAVFVGRALALLLPFSLRPEYTPGVEFNLPIGEPPGILEGWSSMPSDHAVLFFAIATSVFFISRTLGLILLLHASVIICLPRIYLARHWPSDILVGAFVGMSVAVLIYPVLSRFLEQKRFSDLVERYPHLAYPMLFFVLVQISTMFDSLRGLASALREALDLLS